MKELFAEDDNINIPEGIKAYRAFAAALTTPILQKVDPVAHGKIIGGREMTKHDELILRDIERLSKLEKAIDNYMEANHYQVHDELMIDLQHVLNRCGKWFDMLQNSFEEE